MTTESRMRVEVKFGIAHVFDGAEHIANCGEHDKGGLDKANRIAAALSPPARRASEEERIVALEEEVAQWKIASGLERNGCPEDVRPEDVSRRIRALESLVRAADRMREGVESAINSYRRHELDGWEIAVVSTRMQDYDTQRAAVGEIGEE